MKSRKGKFTMRDALIILWPIGILVAFGVILVIMVRYETRRSKRLKQEAADIAHRMTLIHQQEKTSQEKQKRLIYNTDYFDYYQAAFAENPALTERAAVVLYWHDTPLASDFVDNKTEEEKQP